MTPPELHSSVDSPGAGSSAPSPDLVTHPHMAHWGACEIDVRRGEVEAVRPSPLDPDPSPLLGNVAGSVRHRSRVARPAVRRGWLERGPGRDPSPARGADDFVEISWDRALDLVAGELERVYRERRELERGLARCAGVPPAGADETSAHNATGGSAVYGGSYGWASAGRFHHAQSQLHRFLNVLGGFVWGEHTYSNGALTVVMPHVVGSMRAYLDRATAWSTLERHTDLFVCFGGLPLKNTMVTPGGAARHPLRDHLRAARDRGAEIVLVSPLRDDIAEFTDAQWLPLVPGTDVALMLGIAFALVEEGLHDRDFLASHCHGFDRLEAYLRGESWREGEPGGERADGGGRGDVPGDGIAKTPEWAESICQIPAATIRDLARRMASRRTFINVNWSLQRARFGEQPPWMAVALAAMLGQIGLPGGGFGHGYGSLGYVGRPPMRVGPPALPQGKNPVPDMIPFARIADMLLHPGEPFDFDGRRLSYPDIRLVYWCGGNPFHHHQHIGRLRRALARPETIVVHETHWTPMARHADIVLPVTMTLERDDIGGSTHDAVLVAMRKAVEPFAEARDEYDVFADLAERVEWIGGGAVGGRGLRERFTEGRDAMGWLRHMYEGWRARVGQASSLSGTSGLPGAGIPGTFSEVDHARRDRQDACPTPPDFDAFWAAGIHEVHDVERDIVHFADFRADPAGKPLGTPSGKFEIYSETVAGFGYDDCPGMPTWLEPEEWLGAPLARRFPLVLVANNPTTRLHSQLDAGAFSQASKVAGREPIRLHPADAAARGIRDGDVVRVFNDRGSCLAGAVVTDAVRERVVQLATGAWYDPLDPADPDSMCVHGNPNTLTSDVGTSKLARACAGQHALVQVEKWEGEAPRVRAFDPPAGIDGQGSKMA